MMYGTSTDGDRCMFVLRDMIENYMRASRVLIRCVQTATHAEVS